MPSKLQIGLIASVALNAALLGVVGGRMFVKAGVQPAEVAVSPPQSRPRTVSAEVQAAWAQLPKQDRIELGEQFKVLGAQRLSVTKRLRESAARIAEIARTEPFDKTVLQDQVVIYRHLQTGLQQNVDDILVGHLEEMPPEAREIAARGLLTPYYAWMGPPPPEAHPRASDDAAPPEGATRTDASHSPAPAK